MQILFIHWVASGDNFYDNRNYFSCSKKILHADLFEEYPISDIDNIKEFIFNSSVHSSYQ